MKNEDVSSPQNEMARTVFRKLISIIPAHALSLGGGTVLAARWNHRLSLDVDFFFNPDVHDGICNEESTALEESIKNIRGCSREKTCFGRTGGITVIDHVEVSVTPMRTVIEPMRPTFLLDTNLTLQSSAQILYGKIAYRIMECRDITLRDAYDLASAAIYDPESLSEAFAHVNKKTLPHVSALIEALPRGWSKKDGKPLVEPEHQWSEEEIQERFLAVIRNACLQLSREGSRR